MKWLTLRTYRDAFAGLRMAEPIMHEVIRPTRITRVIAASSPPVELFLGSDKR
jgi:hypothetical protein